jgi:uncharacterized protein (DUF488 family)
VTPIFTIGHSTRSIETFLELLGTHEIGQLVDVRALPMSRRHPHFNRDRLTASLTGAGIRYLHLAELGGRRNPLPRSVNGAWRDEAFRGYADYMQTTEFEVALDQLGALAGAARTAILCAEANPAHCHRSLIADALTAHHVEVRHLLGPDPPQPHRMTPFARIVGGRVQYPDADLFDGVDEGPAPLSDASETPDGGR